MTYEDITKRLEKNIARLQGEIKKRDDTSTSIEEVKDVIEKLRKKGIKVSDLEKGLQKAYALFERGAYDEAEELVSNQKLSAEERRTKYEEATEQINSVDRLFKEGNKLKISPKVLKKANDLINNARKKSDEGDYASSLEAIKEAEDSLTEEIEKMEDAIKNLKASAEKVQKAKQNMDTKDAEDLLTNARSFLEKWDYDKALYKMKECDGLIIKRYSEKPILSVTVMDSNGEMLSSLLFGESSFFNVAVENTGKIHAKNVKIGFDDNISMAFPGMGKDKRIEIPALNSGETKTIKVTLSPVQKGGFFSTLSIICDYFDEKYETEKIFEMRAPGEVSGYICEECGATFRTSSDLLIHKRKEHFSLKPPKEPPEILKVDHRIHPSLPGELGNYKILKDDCIGAGGFGIVYKCKHKETDEICAIKIPREIDIWGLKTLDSQEAEKMFKQFEREVEVWYALQKKKPSLLKGIVKLLDHGCTFGRDPYPWMVTEYMPGGNLRNKIGEIDVKTAVNYAVEILEILEEAHYLATVHRDIKPENILFTSDDQLKIGDWGLAKVIVWVSGPSGEVSSGTMKYMAPEQHSRKFGDPDDIPRKIDIYQTAVVLYEMLTSRVPYTNEEGIFMLGELIDEKITPKKPSIYNPNIPPALDNVILGALKKKVKERSKGDDFRAALKKIVRKLK